MMHANGKKQAVALFSKPPIKQLQGSDADFASTKKEELNPSIIQLYYSYE